MEGPAVVSCQQSELAHSDGAGVCVSTCALKAAVVSHLSSKYPVRISLGAHPNHKQIQKGSLENAVQPSGLTYYQMHGLFAFV